MQSLRRTALTAARRGRTTLPRQPRRYAHDEHNHGHNVSEPMGMGFWATVGTIPACWIVYQLAHMDDGEENKTPLLTRLIDKYTEKQEENMRINAAHMDMMEQAGRDRALFMNSSAPIYVDMRFPEIMNNGSPYNVVAGSQVNMDKVIEKFKREHQEANDRKFEALRTNTISSEQTVEEKLPRYRGVELDRAVR